MAEWSNIPFVFFSRDGLQQLMVARMIASLPHGYRRRYRRPANEEADLALRHQKVPESPEQVPIVEQEQKKVGVSRIGLGVSAWLGNALLRTGTISCTRSHVPPARHVCEVGGV